MIEGRRWTFSVSAPTTANELVCIVGSCTELGCWDPCRIIPLTPQRDIESLALDHLSVDASQTDSSSNNGQPDSTLWSMSLQLPLDQVEYRYCIAVIASSPISNPTYVIRRWETHFKPRCIPASITQNGEVSVATFGQSFGQYHVEAGWLVHDSAVHLNLCTSKNHADPITLWKKKHKGKKVRVKVTPVELGSESNVLEDTNDHSNSHAKGPMPAWPLIEVAVLKEGESVFKSQDQFGLVFEEENFTIFQCHLLDPSTVAFLFDFYLEESTGEIPHFIGCSYLLPSNLVDNFGVTSIPITSTRHLPIGQLSVHYMVVKPMPMGISDMSASFTRYWKETWKGLEVGHRGAGNSYHSQPKSCATIRENTIASFKYAAENGADMVEIDVQLSRDFVPVIYHDFHACIALKRKKDQQHSDLLEIPIKDLTLEQLQALKVYHRKEKGLSKFSDEQFEDHQPFPTLEKSLKTVPDTCGFNVEVKWTMQLKDGTYELLHPFELNHFMDLILKVVLEHGCRRKIVFSSFHPDICSMLRLKQNRYPVLFLTQGMSEQWPPYDDVRCQSIRLAALYANSADILGINLHTEDLLRDSTQMDLALKYKLVVFCWGDDNNDRNTIAFLKSLGMHAIIYDKIDVYNSKTEKQSVFLCEDREPLQQAVQEDRLSGREMEPPQPVEAEAAEQATPSPAMESCSASADTDNGTNLSAMLALATKQV